MKSPKLVLHICTLIMSILALSPLLTSVSFADTNRLQKLKPTHDFRQHSEAKVDLGRALMFDKILSGNRNISCATCHHSLAGTGDGLSLPIGEGGIGLGVTRITGGDRVHERVPRNAPPVFNLGDRSFHTLFHDGRVTTIDAGAYPSGCKTPAGTALPHNLESVLACQAMFPVTSGAEMAGQVGENPIADAAAAGDLDSPVGVWALLAARLQENSTYVDMFSHAFDDVDFPHDISFAHAANAIAAFEDSQWRCDNSPFDRYLRGDQGALSYNAKHGMREFYERGNGPACASCHTGIYQTDQAFHAIAVPQIGPGKGDNSPGQSQGVEDFGREQVTGSTDDRLKFRTPTLRNIALTAPYGHSGAYDSLRDMVEHHLNTTASLYAYNENRQAVLPSHSEFDSADYAAMDDPQIVGFIAAHNDLLPMEYSPEQVDSIMEFLHALTDQSCIDLRADIDVQAGVPSGLPIYD